MKYVRKLLNTLKKMYTNDDSNYNYLIDEYEQVIKILQTLSNSSVKT